MNNRLLCRDSVLIYASDQAQELHLEVTGSGRAALKAFPRYATALEQSPHTREDIEAGREMSRIMAISIFAEGVQYEVQVPTQFIKIPEEVE